MKLALGFVLALMIGVICRVAGVPLPAPPVLIGSLLVVAMSVGYTLMDRHVTYSDAKHRAHCGGPTGETAQDMRSPRE